jgi:hypothetical protein
LLKSYQKYYNEARTHLSLQKDAPIPFGQKIEAVAGIVPVRRSLRALCRDRHDAALHRGQLHLQKQA